MSLASSIRDRRIKLAKRAVQCPEKTYRGNKNPDHEPIVSRATMFSRIFDEVKKTISKQYGMNSKDGKFKEHIYVGWTPPMERRNARLIMRRLARRTFRNMRDKMNEQLRQERGE
jgi:hypothetical protein